MKKVKKKDYFDIALLVMFISALTVARYSTNEAVFSISITAVFVLLFVSAIYLPWKLFVWFNQKRSAKA